jgi:hypothetical protein
MPSWLFGANAITALFDSIIDDDIFICRRVIGDDEITARVDSPLIDEAPFPRSPKVHLHSHRPGYLPRTMPRLPAYDSLYHSYALPSTLIAAPFYR